MSKIKIEKIPEVPPAPVQDPEKWLEINTFKCPFGRISPEACKKLRERPYAYGTLIRKENGGYSVPDRTKVRPPVCENCEVYEKLAKEVYEKRRKYFINLENLKKAREKLHSYKEKGLKIEKYRPKTGLKIKKCNLCGFSKEIYKFGLCKNCYKKYEKEILKSYEEIERKGIYKKERHLLIFCKFCKQLGKHKAFGICNKCYKKLRKHSNLKSFLNKNKVGSNLAQNKMKAKNRY